MQKCACDVSVIVAGQCRPGGTASADDKHINSICYNNSEVLDLRTSMSDVQVNVWQATSIAQLSLCARPHYKQGKHNQVNQSKAGKESDKPASTDNPNNERENGNGLYS
eukprot:6408679-Amphidinium_carterae.3